MKKYISKLLPLVALAMMTACGSDDDLPKITPADRGTVTDSDGNQYGWVQIGDLRWTTENARNGQLMTEIEYYTGWEWENAFSDSQIADIEENYLPVYGNLMSWEDACNSAPDGWRLPTDEDWQKLERALGMGNTNSIGMRGTQGVGYSLQDKEGINLLCGGAINKRKVYGWFEFTLDRQNEFGYYWTSTEVDTGRDDYRAAYGRKIISTAPGVDRQKYNIEKYFSVRWVQDVK